MSTRDTYKETLSKRKICAKFPWHLVFQHETFNSDLCLCVNTNHLTGIFNLYVSRLHVEND